MANHRATIRRFRVLGGFKHLSHGGQLMAGQIVRAESVWSARCPCRWAIRMPGIPGPGEVGCRVRPALLLRDSSVAGQFERSREVACIAISGDWTGWAQRAALETPNLCRRTWHRPATPPCGRPIPLGVGL